MQHNSTIAGLVLCGGESKRMGTDKGLIMQDGLPWFRHMGLLIEELQVPVYYSIRPDQFDSYAVFAAPEHFVFDNDISEGPLRGVLSALDATDASTLLIVPCDMIGLKIAVINRLMNAYADGFYDCYAYWDGQFYQPFPGIYSRKTLEQLSHLRSLQRVLSAGSTGSIPIKQQDDFPNLNQPGNSAG